MKKNEPYVMKKILKLENANVKRHTDGAAAAAAAAATATVAAAGTTADIVEGAAGDDEWPTAGAVVRGRFDKTGSSSSSSSSASWPLSTFEPYRFASRNFFGHLSQKVRSFWYGLMRFAPAIRATVVLMRAINLGWTIFRGGFRDLKIKLPLV